MRPWLRPDAAACVLPPRVAVGFFVAPPQDGVDLLLRPGGGAVEARWTSVAAADGQLKRGGAATADGALEPLHLAWVRQALLIHLARAGAAEGEQGVDAVDHWG